MAYGRLVLGLEPAPHHEWMLREMDYAERNQIDTLILMPRGAAKTTWGNTAKNSHKIALHRDIRTGLLAKTDTVAANMSRAVMSIYESNEEHRNLFGNLVHPKKWTQMEWLRSGSKWAVGGKDLSLFAAGTGGAIVSKRFDRLVADDILDAENTQNIDQHDKNRTWWDQTVDPCVMATGTRIVFGTRWAPEDLYFTLGQSIEEGGHGFRVVSIKALIEDPGDDLFDEQRGEWIRKDGLRSYWQEVWPLESLLKRRARNPSIFDLTMQSDIEGILKGDLFDKRDFVPYGTATGDPYEELPDPENFTIRMGGDLASSLKQRADFTAAVTSAEEKGTGHFYVMKAERTKIAEDHATYFWNQFQRTQDIALVLIENQQFQSTVVQNILTMYPRMPVVGRKADTDKVTRARGWSEKVKQGKVHVHRSLLESSWMREVVGFPKGHDDFVDATGLSFDMTGTHFQFGSVRA